MVCYCAAIGTAACQSAPADERLLEPEQFVETYETAESAGAILIDCRTPAEFANGSLTGARNIDFESPDFEARVDSLDSDEAVFIFCQSGGRSGRAAATLSELGFRQVFDLKGGYGNLPPALLLEH